MSVQVCEDAASVLVAVAHRLGPHVGGLDGLLKAVLARSRTVDPDVDGEGSLGPSACGGDAETEVAHLLRSSATCRGRAATTSVYDEVVVLGAATRGIWRRLVLLEDARIDADLLTVLAGRRPHLGRTGAGRDGDVDALLDHAGPFPASNGWTPPPGLVARRRARADDADSWLLAADLFPDETALALMLIDRRRLVGTLDARRTTRLPDGREVAGAVRCAPGGFLECEEVAGRFGRIRVLDGPPVPRSTGRPRPTTASTLAAWVAQGEAAPAGRRRRILVISSQPHLARVGRILDELCVASRLRADIEVAGCPAPPDIRPGVVLRELALQVQHARSEGSRR